MDGKGEHQSERQEKLQIVEPELFLKAAKMAYQRGLNYDAERKISKKHIKGNALLSGLIYCGECGARMNVTTSGKAYTNSAGEESAYRYHRYRCYNVSRHKHLCQASTHKASDIDETVEHVMMMMFSKFAAVPSAEIINLQYNTQVKELEARIKRFSKEVAEKNRDLLILKGEVTKSILGTSSFSPELLNETINIQTQSALPIAIRGRKPKANTKTLQRLYRQRRFNTTHTSIGQLFSLKVTLIQRK